MKIVHLCSYPYIFSYTNFVETKLKITLPQTLEIIIIVFIFAAQMLGRLSAFYLKFSWWDDMLHTLNGFLMAAVGFSSVDILNKSDRFKFFSFHRYLSLLCHSVFL